jgi:hypothetical protein
VRLRIEDFGMNDREHFKAPWGATLKIVSAVASFALIGVAVAILAAPSVPPWTRWLTALMTLGTLLTCGLFTVRGYELGRNDLHVHRLFWDTRIELGSLQAVEADPDATRNSIRLFGNGGLYSFSGWFRNKRLGVYRLCATDPEKAVVLRFPSRVWVVSPERTPDFIRAVLEKAGLR